MLTDLDRIGGVQISEDMLKGIFPNVKRMRKWNITYSFLLQKDVRNHFLSIDDMTKFTNYVETNQQ